MSVTFVTEPTYKRHGKTRLALASPLLMTVEGHGIAVPEDFDFDGASIPFILQVIWWLLASGYKYHPSVLRAAAVHDFFCRNRLVPSQTAHWWFYLILRADGVHPVRAWCFWKGVLWFGPRW